MKEKDTHQDLLTRCSGDSRLRSVLLRAPSLLEDRVDEEARDRNPGRAQLAEARMDLTGLQAWEGQRLVHVAERLNSF